MTLKKGFGGQDGECTDRQKSNVVVVPVPYDKTSTWIKGADKGPFAIIEASDALETYDIETGGEVSEKGIFTQAPLDCSNDPEKTVIDVEKTVCDILKEEKLAVVLGGEHSVSIGAIKAHSSFYKDLSVLQLDAHSDLRDEYEGSRYNHACVMARVKEICPFVQVGIRSMCSEELNKNVPENIFYAEKILKEASLDNWVDRLISRLTDRVYVTIDLDVFDPSIMPSTGTPEPGGLGWYEVLYLLNRLTRERKVVGFDCVELCPNENNKAPDFLAAKLIYKFLGYIFKNRNF